MAILRLSRPPDIGLNPKVHASMSKKRAGRKHTRERQGSTFRHANKNRQREQQCVWGEKERERETHTHTHRERHTERERLAASTVEMHGAHSLV